MIPIKFGSEQKGMQKGDEIENIDHAHEIVLEMMEFCANKSNELAELGIHKSICNRYVEPWMWITVVMTSSKWNNFFRLRCHSDAEVHFQKISNLTKEALYKSKPATRDFGEWHLPYLPDKKELIENNLTEYDLAKISVARCARVSYLTHNGIRDFNKDLELFDRLCQGSGFGHWSPHEHVAVAATKDVKSGPFNGWIQFRKFFENESC